MKQENKNLELEKALEELYNAIEHEEVKSQ
jgi:hypothetical protein